MHIWSIRVISGVEAYRDRRPINLDWEYGPGTEAAVLEIVKRFTAAWDQRKRDEIDPLIDKLTLEVAEEIGDVTIP